MEDNFVTITAVDKNSSDTTSRSFSVGSDILLRAMIKDWIKKDVKYNKFELVTPDFLDEFEQNVQDVLDEFEISN